MSFLKAIESQWFLHGHPLVSLSVQQVLDCVKNTTENCDGGDPIGAYQHGTSDFQRIRLKFLSLFLFEYSDCIKRFDVGFRLSLQGEKRSMPV